MLNHRRFLKLFLLCLVCCYINVSQAGLLYTYHQLALKDLDQMNTLVKNKIKESKSEDSGKIVPLKEALQAIYSRPNQDDMIEKVVDPIKNRLEQEEEYETVIQQLVKEATDALSNVKNFKKDVQVTYAIFLENVISDFKANLKPDNFEYKILAKIAEKKIELTKEARKERQLRLMSEGVSPSQIAEKIIHDFNEKLKQEKIEKEKEEAEKNKSAALQNADDLARIEY